VQNKIKWILQNNLINKEVLNKLKESIISINGVYEEISIIPFSDEINFKNESNETLIFYGSTTLMLNAYKNDSFKNGVFYDKNTFKMENYLKMWGNKMLNSDGEILSAEELIQSKHFNDQSYYFLRPNEDTKLFSGQVMVLSELKNGIVDTIKYNPHANFDTTIFISSPKKIDKEWRNFIVDGKVISSSRYVVNGELSISNTDIPSDMIQFTEECCEIYTPHEIFVMDIALSENEYKIIECNCFNATGFYEHDIELIVKNTNEFLINK
jgi:hypothetical protein